MKCDRCGAQNPGNKAFCGDCGAPLTVKCTRCGSPNPPTAKYCSNCAHALVETGAPAMAAPSRVEKTDSAPTEGERRQLTILFCDLVGSTALSTQFDPEDLHEIITGYHQRVTEIVERHSGFVAQLLGDGVLAYFGYPHAQEDDAERAVRAGLAMVAEVAHLTAGESRLASRVGIATGLTMVGKIGSGASEEVGVIGDTPNLAARLQSVGQPGQVVIAPSTRRLLGSLFELRELGALELKGFSQAIHAVQVLGENKVASRFEALRSSAVPLFGRDAELATLASQWTAACDGTGRLVLVSGEPGIGKSRLIYSFQDQIRSTPHIELHFSCSSRHTGSAFHPIVDRLERMAQFERADTAAQKLDKLGKIVPAGARPETLTLFAELLSIPPDDRCPPLDIDSAERKQAIHDALMSLFLDAHPLPKLMIWEDVHWIDPSSLEFLDATIRVCTRRQILLIATARPEFKFPWAAQPHACVVNLQRLSREHNMALALEVAKGKALPREIIDQIVARTDGVPLFVEELTKALLESGYLVEHTDGYLLIGPIPTLEVPTTLQALLLARIDRLGWARETAQIGAAIGRDFSYPLLAAVSSMAESDLRKSLDRLLGSGLVTSVDTAPNSHFTFKHALIQDAAYSSLTRASRRVIHARIARGLETIFPDLLESNPEIIADHCDKAGDATRAVTLYGNAARQAMRRSAASEANVNADKGLALLKRIAQKDASEQGELPLQLVKGQASIVLRGENSEEAGAAFRRAHVVSSSLGDTQHLFQALDGLCVYHFSRRELPQAMAVAEELLSVGENKRDRQITMTGLRAFGSASFLLGRFAAAHQSFDRLLLLYDSEQDNQLASKTRFDPRVTSLAYLSLCHLVEALSSDALATSAKSVELARQCEHPASLTFALRVAAILHALTSRWSELSAIATEIATISEQHDFPVWAKEAQFFQAWAIYALQRDRAGLITMRESLRDLAAGQPVWPFFLAGLGAVEAQDGNRAEAERLLDRAVAICDKTGELWYEPEVLRQRAELRIGHDELAAEQLLSMALQRARKHEARLWELRAALRLAQLLRHRGRGHDADNVLGEIYESFDHSMILTEISAADQLQPV